MKSKEKIWFYKSFPAHGFKQPLCYASGDVSSTSLKKKSGITIY